MNQISLQNQDEVKAGLADVSVLTLRLRASAHRVDRVTASDRSVFTESIAAIRRDLAIIDLRLTTTDLRLAGAK